MNFYAVIIGTEILNGRRSDKHFEFVKKELAKYGHTLFASFIIKDDKELMTRTYEMVRADPKGVMFSFGGIGSTPDDLTREIASKVFRHSETRRHEKFFQDIVEKFAQEAYPHRIHMADLPPGAELLHNPINNMSGFSLDKRYFFVPGFPSMAHPMVENVIKQYFSKAKQQFRLTLLADTSENTLISLMKQVPNDVELSSLPMFVDNKPKVELSLSAADKKRVEKYFQLFKDTLKEKDIPFKIL